MPALGAASETGGSSGGDACVGAPQIDGLAGPLWMPPLKPGCVNDAGLAEAELRSGA